MLFTKKQKNRILAIFSVSCFFILINLTLLGIVKAAQVTDVVDGDTVVLDDGMKVRLLGIDTPEMGYYDKSKKYIKDPAPKAEAATKYLKQLILGKECNLQFAEEKIDRHNRVLAYLYRDSDGLFLNQQMLVEGLAVISFYPPNLKYRKKFGDLQKGARLARKGIWSLGVVSADDAYKHLTELRTVRGRVKSVYMARNFFYINFGDDYKKDFTIGIVKKNLKYFENLPEAIDKWYTGKTIEVTGRVYDRNGPYIQVALPEQIITLDQ